jgi:hypothetical protein
MMTVDRHDKKSSGFCQLIKRWAQPRTFFFPEEEDSTGLAVEAA